MKNLDVESTYGALVNVYAELAEALRTAKQLDDRCRALESEIGFDRDGLLCNAVLTVEWLRKMAVYVARRERGEGAPADGT